MQSHSRKRLEARAVSLARRRAPQPLQQRTVCIIKVANSLFVGWNDRKKTTPKYVIKAEDGTIISSQHAEIHALSRIPKSTDLRKARVLILRFLAGDGMGLAKPCSGCQRALTAAGIRQDNIYWTNKRTLLSDFAGYDLTD